MSFYSVRNPSETPIHDIGLKRDKEDHIKKPLLCDCGHAKTDHRGHPAMCSKCTCPYFYKSK